MTPPEPPHSETKKHGFSPTAIEDLRARVRGRVLLPTDAGYAEECAGFNTTVVHHPDVVVAIESAEDAVACVRFARTVQTKIHVQGAGHGGEAPIRSGLLVSTRALKRVQIDPLRGVAKIQAGARWGSVIAAAAEHGLAPITGSSPTVGVVGYLMGGGLGPLARSHGFSSDYVLGVNVVTGAEQCLESTLDLNPDVLWAFRGGKGGCGIVTELELRLVPLRTLYAGSLYYDAPHLEAAFRAWVSWTASAPDSVTTSVAIARFPAVDALPPPLRGRTLLVLRFAYPGSAEEGARLAQPLRTAAPIYLDALGEMPAAEVARIHNDPTEPLAASLRSAMLTHVDQDLASALLAHVGAGQSSPFLATEIRHIGGATRRDPPEGTAVGGRESSFTLTCICADPQLFQSAFPAACDRLTTDLTPWLSPHNNINFLAPIRSAEHYASAWPRATYARLAEIRRRYDPERLFEHGYGDE
ncbi:MAG TPA: FAD-binding oxidoreductase [Polyangiaceae bacterium]